MAEAVPREAAVSALEEVKAKTVRLLEVARLASQARRVTLRKDLEHDQRALFAAMGRYSYACKQLEEQRVVRKRIAAVEEGICARRDRIRATVRTLHEANRKLSTALYVAKRQLEREGERGGEIDFESALELGRRIGYTTRAPTADRDGIVYMGTAPFPDDLMLKQSMMSTLHAQAASRKRARPEGAHAATDRTAARADPGQKQEQ